jgi:beta-N-acetylhexosaminidase
MRATVLVLVLAVVCASAGISATTRDSSGETTLEQLVGQRLIVAMRGTAPSAGLLTRVRTGQVGGVILFGGNVRNVLQLRALTRSLRAAARAGNKPALVIAVDQEGGGTRRLAWAPPLRSAAELGRLAPAEVRAEGKATADALRSVGVNVDLAPVADVPRGSGSFIAAQARAFSTDPQRVASLATAFAAGLADGGIAATAKHFPGLGRAQTNTDVAAVTVTATRAELDADVFPYRRLIGSGVPIVMLSNATYAALDEKPAAWSPAVETLLRRTLGFTGVTITDALDAVAPTHGRSVASVAVLSAQAGVDLLLVTGSESESGAVYRRLLGAAETGKIARPALERSYARIIALKRRL